MLPLILFVLLPAAEQASNICADTGASTAVSQTQPARGPNGQTAILKVSTADDHSKNSHLCSADYQLVLTPAAGGTPVAVDLLTSDADYGRGITLRLDGFSKDGKHVFGTITEGGETPSQLLFDYETASSAAQLIDLRKQFSRSLPAKCAVTFGVLGTTEAGGIVFELTSSNQCAPPGRWQVDSTTQKFSRFPKDASMQTLYGP